MAATLVIGNKAYSSWSMRPWLLMRAFEIPFDEVVVPLRTDATRATIERYNPAGKVPVLIDGDVKVWDSLAIIEHITETRPDLPIWPVDPAARALARSLAAEMHSGFSPLRRAYPMNVRRDPKPLDLDPETAADVAANVARIETAWADARARFGEGVAAPAKSGRKPAKPAPGSGPFLFGAFCAADAMFAPIVSRFHAYAVEVGPGTQAYMAAIAALPAWRDWLAGAAAEGWRIEAFETL